MAFAISAMVNSENIVSFPISGSSVNRVIKMDPTMHASLQDVHLRRRLEDKSSSTFPVYQEYGAYYIDIHLGSPPQRQSVLVDTGSENSGLPCADCNNCGDYHTDPNFSHLSSKSFRELKCPDCMSGRCNLKNDTCTVESYYAEKSGWSGNEVEDDVYIGSFNDKSNSNKFRLKFTCMKSNEGAFKKQLSNGIIGMNLDKTSFWSQMYDQGVIKSRKFSLCLNTHPLAKHMIGALTLGGVDERLGHSATDMKYVDFEDSNSLFRVGLRKVYIHSNTGNPQEPNISKNRLVPVNVTEGILNRGGAKLDSGTTGTLMTPALKDPFNEAWKVITGKPFPTDPINLSPEELKQWPVVIFQLKGSKKMNTNPKSEQLNGPISNANYPEDVIISLEPSQYMQLNLNSGSYSPLLKFDGLHGEGR